MKSIQRIMRWDNPIKTDVLKTPRDTASRWPQSRSWHASLRCTFSSVLRSAPQLTRRTYVAHFREMLSIHREGARITALETTANVAKTTSFNGEGEFAMPFRTARHYRVTVEKDGFKRYEQDNSPASGFRQYLFEHCPADRRGHHWHRSTPSSRESVPPTPTRALLSAFASWKICSACPRLLNLTWLTTRSQHHLDHI